MTSPEFPTSLLGLALDTDALDLGLTSEDVVVTSHAVDRYRQRVEAVSRRRAETRIRALIATATWRRRPPAWTRVVLHPGAIYGCSDRRSDVCLFLRARAIVTVMARRSMDERPALDHRIPMQRRVTDRDTTAAS